MSRIVVKIGSSSLTTARGGLDRTQLDNLVAALAEARDAGHQIVLVSSGAIAAGLAPLNLPSRPRDLSTQQAAASVGQGILLRRYTESFAKRGYVVGQLLLTVGDVTRRGNYRNAYRTFARLLELNAVPIVNENDTVATSEIRFGDNDRLAALVSHMVHADRLILLSDVEGLFTGPPTQNGSRLISEVRGPQDIADIDIARPGASRIGTGGMVTKVQAAQIAAEAGIEVTLTSAAQARAALAGESVGTRFLPTRRRRSTRQLWLAHASETHGTLRLDDGAVNAVLRKGASLLPAGVTGTTGAYAAGDPVDLVSPDGKVVARGLVNYDSDEVPRLIGRSTRYLAQALGAEYERELVHRDDMAILYA